MVRRRNFRRVRRGRRGFRRGRGLSRAFNGGLIRGRMHPPTSNASPWVNYVLTFKFGTTVDGNNCILSSKFVEQLRIELGIFGGASVVGKDGKPVVIPGQDIDVRYQRIDVWVQPQQQNSAKNYIVMAPSDFSVLGKTCAKANLKWYEAWGTSVQPAHCHYVWPKSISNVVIGAGVDAIIADFQTAKDEAYLIKVHLLWRPSAPQAYKSVPGRITSLRTFGTQDSPPDEFEILPMEDTAISPLAEQLKASDFR